MAHKSHTFWIVALLVGLSLFVVMLQQTGICAVLANLRLMGRGIVVLFLTCGTRYFLRTVAWYYCIEPAERNVGVFELFNIRLAGETVGELLPVGLFVGESTKAVIVSRQVSGVTPYVSIVIENLIFGISVLVFLLAGVILLLFSPGIPQPVRLAGCLTAVLLALPSTMVIVAVRLHWMVLSRSLSWLKSKNIKWGFLHLRAQAIRRFEEAVFSFYGKHMPQFYGLLFLEFCANWVGVFEAFWVLHVMAGMCSLTTAFLAEFTARLVNSLFSFIPLRLGVDEGGAALLLQYVGYSVTAGVSLAVIRKIRIILWMIPGLALIIRYTYVWPSVQDKG
jgi:glycosyltransferase 2 family protein